MNRLPDAKRAAILRCLTEGNSIRSTARITGTVKATVLKLLVEAGEFCSNYQDQVLRDLDCKRIEADEIWAFVGAKQRNAKKAGDGDIWTFTAIDPDSKLLVSWFVGDRSLESATIFMGDLASRVWSEPLKVDTERAMETFRNHPGGSMTVRRHRRYSTEFKIQLVQAYLDGEGSARSIATRHEVPHSLLMVWIKKYEAGDLTREIHLQEEVVEYGAKIAALERKIGQLTMELDVMKKRALIRPSQQGARPSIISGPGASPSDGDVAS